MKPSYFAARDQDYYPDILLFDDFRAARQQFNEWVADNERYAPSNSNRADKKGQVYFGVVFRSHPMGQSLVDGFWDNDSDPLQSEASEV